MKKFLLALQFLTIIPVKVKDAGEEDFARSRLSGRAEVGSVRAKSRVYFPLVGIIIGLLLVFFNLVTSQLMPRMVSDVFLFIFWIFITGALHLDGLADTMDGFYASTDREKILQVMEDTATGAKGVAALITLLLLKFVLLFNMEGSMKIYSLILVPTISRYFMFMATISSRPARKEGLGKLFIGKAGSVEILISTCFIVVLGYLGFLFLPVKIVGFVAIAVGFIVTLAFVRYCDYKIGGMTGDTLGALNEIVEVATLLAVAVVSFMRGF